MRRFVVLAGVAVLALMGGDHQTASQVSDAELSRGGAIFQANCAACHGAEGEGGRGSGVEGGPPINDVSMAYIDLTLRTGRMPVAVPAVGVFRSQLDEAERHALLAYMEVIFGLEDDRPTVGPGRASQGHEPYVRNCAACHGATGTGGIIGDGVRAPRIDTADPIIVAQAVRAGPFAMPGFREQALTEQQVNDIIAYLKLVDTSPRTPLGLREVDPVGSAVAAVVLTVVTLIAADRCLAWVSCLRRGRETGDRRGGS